MIESALGGVNKQGARSAGNISTGDHDAIVMGILVLEKLMLIVIPAKTGTRAMLKLKFHKVLWS